MKYNYILVIIFSILLVETVWSQSSDIKVRTLVSNDFLKVGINIPLQLYNTSKLFILTKIDALILKEDSTAKDCQLMQDPFYSEIFILRCLNEGYVKLKFIISDPYKVQIIYGPIEIKAEPNQLLRKNSSNYNNSPITENSKKTGSQLYSDNCTLNCHGSKTIFLETFSAPSSSKISEALTTVTRMQEQTQLLNLTPTDIQKISNYLNGLE